MSESLDLTERTFGEFRLLRPLGKGGMAEVYLAEQTSLQRYVAVKVMRPELITGSDTVMLQRFKQEATTAAGLTHPNIVQVYTIGEQDGFHYIAQEYVQGKNLAEFLKTKGPPDLPVALLIMRQIANALKAAGAAGIIHRDVKPENIMLTRKGEVKVADFGLAQLTVRHGKEANLTQLGTTIGTPLYMSPEQITGKQIDHRTDIYSFGVLSYHMLCGSPPFLGETAMVIAVQHVNKQPPPLKDRADHLPELVCRVVHRMMAKHVEHRYPTADAVLQDLKSLAAAVKKGAILKDMQLPVLPKLEARDKPARPDSRGKSTGRTAPKASHEEPALKPLAGSDPPRTSTERPAAERKPEPSESRKRSVPVGPETVVSPIPAGRPAAKPGQSKTKADAAPAAPAARPRRETTKRRPPDPKPDVARTVPEPTKRPKPRKRDDDDEPLAIRRFQSGAEEMDLTPMVDVTFLLLIFFMITAAFTLQKTIEVPPPDTDEKGAQQTNPLPELEEDSVMVEIDEDNAIFVDDIPLADALDLVKVLNDKMLIDHKTELILEADEMALHETVVLVFDAAQEVKMQKIRQVVRTTE